MEKGINNISFEAHDLPSGLYEKVLRGIDQERIKRAKRDLLISRTGVALSIMAFIPAAMYLYNDLYQTGFLQLLALMFHGGDLVMHYWQDFSSALLETLPIMNLSFCLSALFVFLISLRMSIVSLYRQSRLQEGALHIAI